MIPQNIKSEHILKAIEEAERSGIPRERSSDRYDLEYNKKIYPPKYIISLANKYVNGIELDHSEFSGGDEANDFLKSLGFNIADKQNNADEDDLEEQRHDFAPRLKDYLENIYSIKVDKGKARAHLTFPSGTTINVRGSIVLKDHRGFYHLQEEDYNEILDNTNRYFAVVFGSPENTFIFPKESLKTFFSGSSPILQEGKKPKWYFDIREDNGKHYLQIRSTGGNELNIDNYLNKWDQIEDFKPFYEETYKVDSPNYWILVVTDKRQQNITAKQILTTRMNDKFWGLNARTPSRTLLRKDDKVIFSYGAKEFLGLATLESDPFELTEEQRNQFSHDDEFFKTDFGVRLKDAKLWEDAKPIQKFVDVLSFIKNKGRYMAYFQGGIRKLSKEDYNNILNTSSSRNLLSFVDLQKFLLEEMQMQANYQPIMIRTLLQSGGNATKEDIAAKIKDLNSQKDQDFKNIPVYDVLENHGIVRKHGSEYILNSEELTVEQSGQLVALCNWKILTQPLQFEELIEAFDKNRLLFDPDRISLEESERLRTSFVSDFPIDKIQAMKLDDYVPGKPDPKSSQVDKTTFCYRLERSLPWQGSIQGVVAQKFGIYFNSEEKAYKYNKEKYDSPEKAFDAIKTETYSILQVGKQFKEHKNWKTLSEILECHDYNIYRLVRSKILSVYYPEYFIQIHSLIHLQRILEAFGKSTIDIEDKLFLSQARLLEVKEEHPIMKQWHNKDFSHFVWQVVIERDSASNKKSDKRWDTATDNKLSIWIVRAGAHGEQENDVLEKGIVTIGWNQLPDLSHIEDKKSLKQLYFKGNPNAKAMSVSNMVGSIWRFVNEIKNGDLVVLPLISHKSNTMAVGRVEGDYEYKELSQDIKHIRPVKWLAKSILKSQFDEDIVKYLQIPMTVFQIKDGNAIKAIVKVLQKYGISDIDIYTDSFDAIDSDSAIRKQENTITLQDVSRQTYFATDVINEIELLLNDKKHVIFYGPPGTSKTYFAKKFAQYFAGNVDNVEIIQFHPSYSYEDFIEGIKPNLSETGLASGFSRQDGVFKRLVNKCVANPYSKYVLIIDEINRGNIAKIFGELIYLLEYREEKITLTYSPNEKFSIPSNLYILCTMNSADRSIAFVDYALRRRFYFRNFYPESNPDLLHKWFRDHPSQIDPETIITMLENINKIISEKLGREYQIGHSYFMKKDLDHISLKTIINYAIIPLLEQYFFGKKERLEEIKKYITATNMY